MVVKPFMKKEGHRCKINFREALVNYVFSWKVFQNVRMDRLRNIHVFDGERWSKTRECEISKVTDFLNDCLFYCGKWLESHPEERHRRYNKDFKVAQFVSWSRDRSAEDKLHEVPCVHKILQNNKPLEDSFRKRLQRH